MQVKEVTFRNFRNIAEAELVFSPGVNILWGDNAQGKTNALEGIYCFACGKSFRGVKDRELISFGAEAGGADIVFDDAQREQRLSLRLFSEKTREMKHNGIPVRRSADFVGIFHGVLFCPEHLSMIKGAPQLRRSFLDAAISQLRPAYLASLSEYARILKQRNALLKAEEQPISARMPLYEVLTHQMAEVNARIVITRSRYVKLLSSSAAAFLDDMTAGGEQLSLDYVSDMDCASSPDSGTDPAAYAERYYEKCVSYAQREFAAQTTLHGCHRDDIAVTLNGREARLYASQGQDRSIALAMKLSEGELSRTVTGEYPVFLFDDVLSELDGARQSYLMQRLGGRQVILTSCNESLFTGMDASLIRVKNGVYYR